MKKLKNTFSKKLGIILILFYIYVQSAYSQRDENSGMRNVLINNVECAPSDFQIEIGTVKFDAGGTTLGIFKKSGSGFVCAESLPVIITIYSKISGMPVSATDVVWSGNIDGSFGHINQGLLTETHFNNTDYAIFSVRFIENGITTEIVNFKVSKDIKTFALKKNNPSMIFDDVRDKDGKYITEYWPSHTPAEEKPWLFVPEASNQNIKLSIKNKKQKAAGKDAWKVVPVNTHGSGSSINPNQFSGDDSDFSAGQSISTSAPYPFIGSCGFDTVTYLYSQPSVSYGLEFKLLAFTHDDVQVNYGPVASDTTLCVAVGPDGYYTEAFRHQTTTYRGGPFYVSTKDSIIFSTLSGHTYVSKIVAGKDKNCDTNVPSFPTHYNSVPNYNLWVNQCNSIYNQIGVSFFFYSYDTLIVPEFNQYDKKIDGAELDILHALYNLENPDNVMVYLSDSIFHPTAGNVARGRATYFGVPKVAVAGFANGFTMAHEIGHGKFSLRHPDNDIDHLRFPGDMPPSSGPFNIKDTDNFMFSNYDLRKNRIRHYQWKKILTNQYKD